MMNNDMTLSKSTAGAVQNNQTNKSMNLDNVTFGIELETTIPTTTYIRVGHHGAGIPVTGMVTHMHATSPNVSCQTEAPTFNGAGWKADRDPSIVCPSGRMACEFVSPILKGNAGVEHLVEFVRFLVAIGAKVNSSCGLHIHVGVQSLVGGAELSAEQVEARKAHILVCLGRIVHRVATGLYAQTGTIDRENGRWCARPGTEFQNMVQRIGREKSVSSAASDYNRYRLLNTSSMSRHGTVEFRCFAGTLNIGKILGHLGSVLAIAVTAANHKTTPVWFKGPEQTGRKVVGNILRLSGFCAVWQMPAMACHEPLIRETLDAKARKYDEARRIYRASAGLPAIAE